MSQIKREQQQPQPLLLSNPSQEDIHRVTLKSATYRSNEGRRLSGSKEELSNRIANQLKRIGPEDLGMKSQKSVGNLNVRQSNLYTQTSGQYIKECPEYSLQNIKNPEVLQRLDQLAEKINLIQYRQKKMQAKSRYSTNKEEIQTHKFSRTVKSFAKTPTSNLNQVSKAVVKELKTVRNEIQQLKQIVFTIKQENAEQKFRSNTIRNREQRAAGMQKLLTTLPSKISQIHKMVETRRKSNQRETEKRTVFYTKQLGDTASHKNILLNSNQLLEEVEFEVKRRNLSQGLRRGKSKPVLSDHISSIPRGLSKKSIRAKTANKKSIASPYCHEMVRSKSKSHVEKLVLKRNPGENEDQISAIQDNFSQEELMKKMMIFPKLPEGFNPLLNSQELLDLATKVMRAFNMSSKLTSPITIKKYKNCVFFSHLKTNILWNYDGKFYIGGWASQGQEEGCKEGDGIQYVPEKYIYNGKFHKGKRHGHGMMNSHNGQYYKGNWRDGFRHGKGKLEQATGCVYEGDWNHGRKQGYGQIKYSKKESYQGLFKDGLKHGLGKEVFQTGDSYQGEYYNGKFEGLGIYRWANGASYNGEFREGFRHGRGTWTSNNSVTCDIYQGDYVRDSKCGNGKYNWSNGSTYIGAFFNDYKHGQGTVYYNDGKILQALWQNGHIVKRLYSQKAKSPSKN